MCNCGCRQQAQDQAVSEDEQKSYICYQCNAFKAAPKDAPAPECCGKKMQEMD